MTIFTHHARRSLTALVIATTVGCAPAAPADDADAAADGSAVMADAGDASAMSSEASVGEGEHREGGGEGDPDSGDEEESGVSVARDATWDAVRRGARLVLSYDAAKSAFMGRVDNTTTSTLCQVRVEVHLANGPELGPTVGIDLAAGESVGVQLASSGNSVDRWTAHPEMSPCK